MSVLLLSILGGVVSPLCWVIVGELNAVVFGYVLEEKDGFGNRGMWGYVELPGSEVKSSGTEIGIRLRMRIQI